MLKVVIFDGGFGGELFADYVESEIPILEIIRVIDWRNSDLLLRNPRAARHLAEEALRPYIGEVDLIVFANFLLSLDLKYFRRKFKEQKFVGFPLFINRAKTCSSPALILTTRALRTSFAYHSFLRQLKLTTKSIVLDDWPRLIDDGELSDRTVLKVLGPLKSLQPGLIFLACTEFYDLRPIIYEIFGPTTRIEDNFHLTLRSICHELKLRGLDGKKS